MAQSSLAQCLGVRALKNVLSLSAHRVHLERPGPADPCDAGSMENLYGSGNTPAVHPSSFTRSLRARATILILYLRKSIKLHIFLSRVEFEQVCLTHSNFIQLYSEGVAARSSRDACLHCEASIVTADLTCTQRHGGAMRSTDGY